MNPKARLALILALVLLGGAALVAVTWAAPGQASLAQGGAPTVVSYQGELQVGGTPYSGSGYFKFAIVNAAGSTTYWSNDGTSTGGGTPTAAVQLTVSEGLFGLLLGDSALGGMTQALTADVFSHPERYLRVWFSDDGSAFDQLTPDTRIGSAPYALQAQEAVDADTVDGLHAGELETHYQNVVIVAKSGGDYTSVQAAIDSITGAAADTPYLVWVAPGVYSETVTMKPYVHVQGAGQEATVITSTVSGSVWPPQATLKLASDASLRDLTVGNSGDGDLNAALLATAGTTRTLVADVTARAQGGGVSNHAIVLNGNGTSIVLQQVSALAEGGSAGNTGLANYNGSVVMLRGGSFTGRGGKYTCGIKNAIGGATLEADSVTALAENGSSSNYGLYNYNGVVATLRGSSFAGRGGRDALGIYNSVSGTLEAESVTVLAENGSSSNYGLANWHSAARLRGGSVTGRGGTDARGIYNLYGTLDVGSVTALAENGGTRNIGLTNAAGAAATLRGGSFTGRGGTTEAYGISTSGSGTTLDAESVTALAENGSGSNCGLANYNGAAATLRGGSFTGRGGTTEAYGISTSGSGTTLDAESVTALGEDGSGNRGLDNRDGAAAMLRGGSFTGRGGTYPRGIINLGNGTTLEAESVTVLGENGSGSSNHGLVNDQGAAATLRGGSFTGRDGINAYGIFNASSGTTLEAESVTALGEDASPFNRGLYNDSSARANVTQSVLEGATWSVHCEHLTRFVTVSNSRLVGGGLTGTAICVAVSWNTTFNANGCP